jgi:hypothetical protein
LGRTNAEIQRLDMQVLVEQWNAGVLVIDSDLSDELLETWKSAWHQWGQAIHHALDRAKAAGLVAERVMGSDASSYPQSEAITDLVAKYALDPQDVEFVLTGAWVDGEDSGCVVDVRNTLRDMGFSTQIESAMDINLEHGEDEDLDDDLEEDDLPPAASASRRLGF